MKKHLITLLAIILGTASLQAQKYTITGFVNDASNGEKLLGANVYNKQTYAGCVTNNYGFYSLTQPVEKWMLSIHLSGINH